MKYTRHTYIMQFPKDIQMGILRAVRRNLRERGLRGTKLDIAVNNAKYGTLTDLEDVIYVDYWLMKADKH